MTDLFLAGAVAAVSLAVMYLCCARPMVRGMRHTAACCPPCVDTTQPGELSRLRRQLAELRADTRHDTAHAASPDLTAAGKPTAGSRA